MPDTENDLLLFQLMKKTNLSIEDARLIKQWIDSIISSSFEVAISKIPRVEHNCPIPPKFASEVSALVRAVETIGEGNAAHGIARMQENHNYLTSIRGAQKTVAKSALMAFALVVVTGVCMAIWGYAKSKVGK